MEEQRKHMLRKTADLITSLKKSVFEVYLQDYHKARLVYHESISDLMEIRQYMHTQTGGEGLAGEELEASIQYLKENGLHDAGLFGDIVEKDLIPSLEKCVLELDGLTRIEEDGYSIEATASGYYTLKKDEVYLHSNDNPMIADWHLAKSCFRPERESYAVLGCGLGYHLMELYRISTGAAKIYAYEPDEKVIELGYRYGVLGEIPKEALSVVHDPDIMEFLLHSQNEDAGIFMHLPTILSLRNKEIQGIARQLFIQWNTKRQFQDIQEINFRKNKENCKKYLEELPGRGTYAEAVIVAAGPSLDGCMEWLQKKQGQILIIAVSTVFQKLLSAGIRPDYVVVMDPQQRTFGHLKELLWETVPLLVAPYAYWEFAQRYQGEKYLSCFREEAGGSFQIGGTVTTLALETAIYLEVQKIYLAGVDMAFPGGMTHAFGTMDQSVKSSKHLIPVPGVGGTTVYADEPFIIYRQWIERRIRETRQITYVNLSRTGARIEGTLEEKNGNGE